MVSVYCSALLYYGRSNLVEANDLIKSCLHLDFCRENKANVLMPNSISSYMFFFNRKADTRPFTTQPISIQR